MDHVVGSFCGAAATITNSAAFAFTHMTAIALHERSASIKGTDDNEKVPPHQLTTSRCGFTASRLPLQYAHTDTWIGYVDRIAFKSGLG